jgi:hypothetical protein
MIAFLLALILIAVLLCSEAGRAILAVALVAALALIALGIGAAILFAIHSWLQTPTGKPVANVLGGAVLLFLACILVLGVVASCVAFVQRQRDKTRKLWRVGECDRGREGIEYAPVVAGELSEFAPRGHPAPYKAIKVRVARLNRLTDWCFRKPQRLRIERRRVREWR